MENRLKMNAFILLAFVVFAQGELTQSNDNTKDALTTANVPSSHTTANISISIPSTNTPAIPISSTNTPISIPSTTVVNNISTEIVNIQIFYEATSTESATFLNTSFKPTYEKLNKSIHVTFNPFTSESTSEVKIVKCQKDINECKADKIHACGIEKITDKDQSLEFIICALNQKTQHNDTNPTSIIEKCKNSLDSSIIESIKNCTTNYSEWYPLLERYYNEAINNNVTKILTVFINKNIENDTKNFKKDLCNAILNHDKLDACRSGSPQTVAYGVLPLLIGVYYFIRMF